MLLGEWCKEDFEAVIKDLRDEAAMSIRLGMLEDLKIIDAAIMALVVTRNTRFRPKE